MSGFTTGPCDVWRRSCLGSAFCLSARRVLARPLRLFSRLQLWRPSFGLVAFAMFWGIGIFGALSLHWPLGPEERGCRPRALRRVGAVRSLARSRTHLRRRFESQSPFFPPPPSARIHSLRLRRPALKPRDWAFLFPLLFPRPSWGFDVDPHPLAFFVGGVLLLRRRGGVAPQQARIGAPGSLIRIGLGVGGDIGRRLRSGMAGWDRGMGSRGGARWAAGVPLVANGPSAFSIPFPFRFPGNKDPDSATQRSARMIAR